MTGTPPPQQGSSPLTRRRFGAALLGAGAAGLVGVGLAPQAHAASPVGSSPSPVLPGEYYRKANQRSDNTGVLYDDIAVKISGDPSRLFIPQSLKAYSGQPVRVVWLYHGAGSDHNAIANGFKGISHRLVETGVVVICQNAGGTLYSHPTAQSIQKAGYAWVAKLFPVSANVLRATSGGGALACETLGSRLIPNIAGLYTVNAVYDLFALYSGDGRDRASIVAAFGDDPAAIQAANPRRLPQSAWAGTTLRVVVSQPSSSDVTVPPDQHGLALLSLAQPVAASATMRAHANGHQTPGFAEPDFLSALATWAPPPADALAPAVAVTSPAAGASVVGTTTLVARSTDNTAVTGVTFTVGGVQLVATGSSTTDDFTASFDSTTVPSGPTTVTATARDAAGGTTTSAPVGITVANADTTAPAIAVTSPAAGATVTGPAVLVARATDGTGVTAVTFTVGTAQVVATRSGTTDDFTATVDSTTLPNGATTATATARDAAGNTTTSTPVSITVANADTTAPTVSITSPAAGATVAGTTTLVARSTDNTGVIAVTFTVGGLQVAATRSGATDDFTAALDSTALPNGTATATATARDAAGNTTTSAPVSLTVANADTTAPTVSITSPAAGTSVTTGSVAVTAVASDATGVVSVVFALGSASAPGTSSPAGWAATIDTRGLADGTHQLTATARDAAGNTTTSAPVALGVTNADTTPPSVSITSPTAGAVISGTVTATATAQDDRAVTGVTFYANGRLVGPASLVSGVWRLTFNTTKFAVGSYSLTARAADAAGNSTDSAAVPVTLRR